MTLCRCEARVAVLASRPVRGNAGQDGLQASRVVCDRGDLGPQLQQRRVGECGGTGGERVDLDIERAAPREPVRPLPKRRDNVHVSPLPMVSDIGYCVPRDDAFSSGPRLFLGWPGLIAASSIETGAVLPSSHGCAR